MLASMRTLALWISLLSLNGLALADRALAQAGSGSSGFGGGGGGSSLGGSGRGGGSGEGDPLVVVVVFGLVGLFILYGFFLTLRFRRKLRKREEAVHAASAEAAEDDAHFAAGELERHAIGLFRACQEAWDARDRARLARLVGPDLLVEWERRLDDFESKGWHNRVHVKADPEIQYVGLVNREDDSDDRAVVRIDAKLHAYVLDRSGSKVLRKGAGSENVRLIEYWTIAPVNGHWQVMSIDPDTGGEHHLDAKVVASPWSDHERLGDEALTELAVADGLPEGFTTADLADLDFDGDAHAQALDLSLADARFAPDVLEAAARRAVEAWVEAVDGGDEALERVASSEAVSALLYGGDASRRTRVVVRGAGVKRVRVAAVQVDSEPATMTIDLELGGRRYTEDRDTAAVLSGSKENATTFDERWTLALDGPPEAPWRLVDAYPAGSSAKLTPSES